MLRYGKRNITTTVKRLGLLRPALAPISPSISLQWRQESVASLATAAKSAPKKGSTASKAAAAAPAAELDTAVIAQWRRIKHAPAYRDCVLLFQLGSFYEALFEDAKTVSDICSVLLTTKGGSLRVGGALVPMAGVPLRTAETHIAKLLKAGKRVVLVDQAEGYGRLSTAGSGSGAPPPGPPVAGAGSGGAGFTGLQAALMAAAKARGASGALLDRRVSRVLTPGTAADFVEPSAKAHHYLAALAISGTPSSSPDGTTPAPVRMALAFADLSTGSFHVKATDADSLRSDLAVYCPAELLLPSLHPDIGPPATPTATSTSAAAANAVSVALESVTSLHSGSGSSGSSSGRERERLFSGVAHCTRYTAAAFTPRGGISRLAHMLARRGGGSTGAGPAAAAAHAMGSSATAVEHEGREIHESFTDLELSAIGGLLHYVSFTHPLAPPPLHAPVALTDAAAVSAPAKPAAANTPAAAATTATAAAAPTTPWTGPALSYMRLSESTLRALELERPTNGQRRDKGCLLALLDSYARTYAGSRLMDARLCRPLASLEPLLHRHDAVEVLVVHERLREVVRDALRDVKDIERCLQRISSGRWRGAADLMLLRESVRAAARAGYLLTGRGEPVASTAVRAALAEPSASGAAASGSSTDDPLAALSALRESAVAAAAGVFGCTPAALPSVLLDQLRFDFDVLHPLPPRQALPAGVEHLASSAVLSQLAAALTTPLLPQHVPATATATAAADAAEAVQEDDQGLLHDVTHVEWPDSLAAAFAHLEAALEHVSVSVSSGSGSGSSSASGGASDGEGEGGVTTAEVSTMRGGVRIAAGYSPALDAARQRAWIAHAARGALEQWFGAAIGIPPDADRAGIPSVAVRGSVRDGLVLEVNVKGGREAALNAFLARQAQELGNRAALSASSRAGTKASRRASAAAAAAASAAAASADTAPVDAAKSAEDVISLLIQDPSELLLREKEHHRGSSSGGGSSGSGGGSKAGIRRFTCAALDKLDDTLLQATARVEALEAGVLSELVQRVNGASEGIRMFARAAAVLDVTCALAQLAAHRRLTRPVMTAEGQPIRARGISSGAGSGAAAAAEPSAAARKSSSSNSKRGKKKAEQAETQAQQGDATEQDVGRSELVLNQCVHLVVQDAILSGSDGLLPPSASAEGTEGAEGAVVEEVDETVLQEQQQQQETEGVGATDDHASSGGRGYSRSLRYIPNDVVLRGPPAASWAPALARPPAAWATLPPQPQPQLHSNGVVASALAATEVQRLKAAHTCLVLGPNMAGKTTLLRSAAQAAVLAQMGSFVPAASARLGLVDQVFTRVGAHDNVSQHASTFMVEMRETAHILQHATPRSLVVVDEVGRGTAVFDGLALALAALEHLTHTLQCRTLFASHFPELAVLTLQQPGRAAAIRAMLVDWQPDGANRVVTTHQLKLHPVHALPPGTDMQDPRLLALLGTSASFGVTVAEAAGVPAPVVQRARSLIAGLESTGIGAAWAQALLGAMGKGGAAASGKVPS